MNASARAQVAVIGAGMAGATCARLLADAGHVVRLFDKSRGVGGRMATRRVEWADADGAVHRSVFDHGAPGFVARTPAFNRFVEQAHRDGLLTRWVPMIAPGGPAPRADDAWWVPVPDMPSMCRGLTASLPVTLGCAVDVLRREAGRWRVESAGHVVGEGFTDVVVAIPPRQAAALLEPHGAAWAARAQALTMLPCWTLMGVTADVSIYASTDAQADAQVAAEWSLARPAHGPLAVIVHNDSKPGRERVPGLTHWVAHATPAWSEAHLEAPAAEVQAALQAAMSQALGRSLTWQHAAVHRWRYASAPHAAGSTSASTVEARPCWWDASNGLGVCGDALGAGVGIDGVEAAWRSGHALAAALIDRHSILSDDTRP